MGALWQDFHYGLRMLRKNPGFTAIALVTLAMGIGANTIMFGVVNVLLLRSPQVKAPDQLVVCKARNAYGGFPYPAYIETRDTNPVFSDLMAYDTGLNFLTFVRGDVNRRVYGAYVSANYFSFLGVAPAYGRTFLPEEERYGAEPVVVLSHRTWQRQGADPNMVGSQVTLNGTFFRVVGIAPKGFTGTTIIGPDLWMPLGTYGHVAHLGREKPERLPPDRWNYPWVDPVGRLKSGLTVPAAQAQLRSLVPRLMENYPRWWKRKGSFDLCEMPRLATTNGDDATMLSVTSGVLMAVSGVVLLIACLNLANMLVVQGAGRHREIAIRLALGGGRWRIVRQLFIESLLLALLGGALGLILAFWGTRVLNASIATLRGPIEVATSLRIGLDGRVLAATLGFCLLATVLFGLKPALRLSRRDVIMDMKESAGSLRSARRRRRIMPRGLSVVCQIALSVVLVMGAALFTRSAFNAAHANSDFNFDGKLVFEIDPLAAGYDRPRSAQVCETVADHLRSLPGIQAVSVSHAFPFTDGDSFGGSVCEYVPGIADDAPRDILVKHSTGCGVGPDYFSAMEMPLLRGRIFRRLDREADAEKVVIVDERLARQLRPDGDALGCLIQFGRPRSNFWSPPHRVVGVVANLRTISDSHEDIPHMYAPIESHRVPRFVHVRAPGLTRGTKAALLQKIPEEIRRIAPSLPVVSAMTLADCHRNNPIIWMAGIGARLAFLSGAMALFLASLGIYGVKGHMVASRTPEIGIRKALGATHRDVVGMVLREGLVLTLVGLVIGLLLGLGVGRLAASMLYDIKPADPLSIAATVALLGAASLLAGYIPARRAARIDPMVALRYE
jgi:putative ABC transport system permease protein